MYSLYDKWTLNLSNDVRILCVTDKAVHVNAVVFLQYTVSEDNVGVFLDIIIYEIMFVELT